MPSEQPIIIRAAQGIGTVTLNGAGHNIVVKFSGTSHVILRDMLITGGGYHGVFFDLAAHHITIENNWIYDNNAVQPMNSHAEIKGSGGSDANRPDHITIKGNRIYHTVHPPGGNFQGIDCNRCDNFQIIGNHIYDIGQPSGRTASYYDQGACIQMKSLSKYTVIANNRIERCPIGILYGGEGYHSPEHLGGIVRNNLILHSDNIGLVIANVEDGKVHNNIFYGNYRDVLLGSDRGHNRPRNDVDIAHNIFAMPPEELIFEGASIHDNIIVPPEDAEAFFVDAKGGDFQLKQPAEAP